MSTGAYLYSPRFLDHDPPPDSLTVAGRPLPLGEENVSNARLTAEAHQLFERIGVLDQLRCVDPEPIEPGLLESVHDPAYLRRLERACAGGRWDGHSATAVPATYEVAKLCAGAAAQAVRLVLGGDADWAFINARPPGHHAERDRAMGNCFINNVACAAEQARRLGCDRVMIVDWDVHIGNGAHQIFWDRPDVLALSLHQDRWYPRHAGQLKQTGGPGAEGLTVNVPLPPATTDDGYVLALESVIRPIAARFSPDLLIVAAGQDPSIFDPMGRMVVTADGFRRMAEAVRAIAAEVTAGRLVCSVEGGYSHMYTALCTLAVLEGLLGTDSATTDPYAGDPELDVAADPPSEAVHAALAAVRATHPRWFQ